MEKNTSTLNSLLKIPFVLLKKKFAYFSNKGFSISTSDDICDRFTFWKPDTDNKQEYQAKHWNDKLEHIKPTRLTATDLTFDLL